MINTKILLNGSEVTDFPRFQVVKSIGDANISSNFEAELNNMAGRNSDKYNIGDNIQVYSALNNTNIGSNIVNSQIVQSGAYNSGLVFYNKLDSSIGSYIYDEIAGISGLISSGAYQTDGKLGSAYSFGSPASIITSGGIYSLKGNYSVSISAWISPFYSTYNTTVDPLIFSNGFWSGNTTSFFSHTLGMFNGSIQGQINYMSGPGVDSWNTRNITAKLPDETPTWKQVGMSYNGSSIVVYYNGSILASTSYTGSGQGLLGSSSGYISIGRNVSTDTLNSFFSGLTDDIRVFNYDIGSVGMAAIYNSGAPQVYSSGNIYEYTYYTTGLIFNGIVEDIEYDGEGIYENMKVLGRDYSARLMDRTVEPEVYTNLQPGSIVKDIINKYTNDITTSGVEIAGSPISRISFVHVPVYEAIKQLADLQEYIFYVDNNKDLHYTPYAGSSSGYTLDNTNVVIGDFAERRDTVYNQIWVYGDRYLDGFKQVFKAGSPVGGSVFTLLYNPHNTEIISGLAGSSIQPGAILNMSQSIGSDVKYLVDYDTKQIIFTSGTSQGNNIPVSGNTFTINYKRLLPIVKVGDDESSKAKYGTRVKVITDKSIKDPRTATLIMQNELALNSEPIVEGNLDIDGIPTINAGDTVIANFPNNNVDNETYQVLQSTYDFTKENCLSDRVLKVKLNRKLPDITDQIKQIMMDLKKLKSQDMTDADLITRFQTSAGSYSIRPSGIQVFTRSIAGDTMIYDSPVFGIYGTSKYGGSPFYTSFILGTFGLLGQAPLGENLSSWNLVYSGGYY
jgi:hypothetical protein